jgi:hypothetical protein
VAGSQIETLKYGLNRMCSGFESLPALPRLALGAAFVAKIGAGSKAFSQRAADFRPRAQGTEIPI